LVIKVLNIIDARCNHEVFPSNFIRQSLSQEADSRSANQDIPYLLQNMEFH